MKRLGAFLSLAEIFFICSMSAQNNHPRLLLTSQNVDVMKKSIGKYPLWTQVFQRTKQQVDAALSRPIDVPVPKDAAGYTHSRHKQNYCEMQMAGVLFQVTGDKRYAQFVKEMLLAYANLYPTLKPHPEAIGGEGGRLFWQSLNETVWLVNAVQAYDCVYNWLTPADRKIIEQNLFRVIAEFFLTEHKADIDRIHNHGTWMVASIGLLGYVLHDQNLVDIALYGTKKDRSAGFLKQMELLYSPDGYYTEGAYYARYAIQPFFVFAHAIENNQPELKIFQYRDQILRKALYAVFQLSYTNGALIPINDAIKEKNILSEELVMALDITYQMYGKYKSLLTLAKQQNLVSFDGSGAEVAKDLMENTALPTFSYNSVELRDGAHGDEGALGLLRSGPITDQSFLVMKYTAQGMGHGHYDKLGFLFYDQGREIIQDYGSVRFVNVDPKWGGRYLPENNSWAKQTVGHNTLVVDEQSDFKGKYETAQDKHCDRFFFNVSDSNFQVMSAKSSDAYPGVLMHRTMALVKYDKDNAPLVVDVFRATSDKEHQYDLAFYYMGQFITTNVAYTSFTNSQTPLGKKNGYQHLWKEAEGKSNGPVQFTWLSGNRYYSLTSAADTNTQVFFTLIGANDPNFNLRRESGIVLRTKAKENIYATVIEPHGQFDGNKEISEGATGTIKSVQIVASNEEGTVLQIISDDSTRWTMMIANTNPAEQAHHTIQTGSGKFSWTGPATFQKIK